MLLTGLRARSEGPTLCYNVGLPAPSCGSDMPNRADLGTAPLLADASDAQTLAPPKWLAVVLGVVLTLAVRGYRYGESNHAVYLLAALRRVNPSLLRNDWWTTSTLQYHYVFNFLSGVLMRAGIIEPAFLVGYLALAVMLHLAWLRVARQLGGGFSEYLVSVVLFYLLAAGLGLGSYHFLQDSSFLPSNVSNVAMLWGLSYWIAGKRRAAGIALGIAGLFHINHALMVIGMWGALSLLERWRRSPSAGATCKKEWILGSIALLLLCAPAIAPAVRTVLTRSRAIPLNEFVDLFVHLRHPHHFDPMTWHWALWLVYLAPFPMAIAWTRRTRSVEMSRAVEITLLIVATTTFALWGAGFWYVSETLVQLNLYRFSIYPKLFACIGCACWLTNLGLLRTQPRTVAVALIGLLMFGIVAATQKLGESAGEFVRQNAPGTLLALAAAGIAVTLAGMKGVKRAEGIVVALVMLGATGYLWPRLGLSVDAVRADPPDYIALAKWARKNTPVDAIFLVPPQEQSFRLNARRAIVVNFKNVPQLGAELPEWRDRLQKTLGLSDLMTLPRGMGKTLNAMGARYASLPPEQLAQTARLYKAAYLVTSGEADAPPESGLGFMYQSGRYRLYHVAGIP
jgi:hypothetical protein